MANLSALLEKEASAEIEVVLSEARERASEIVAKAQEEAKNIVSTRERAAASQREGTLVQASSSAQLEAASLKLRAQNDKVEAVYTEAVNQLQALIKDGGKFKPVLASLLKEAQGAVGKLTKITVNPADAGQIEAPKGVEIIKDKNLVGGVRVQGEGSNATIENTLLGRLESLKEGLSSEVLKALLSSKAT